MSRVSETHSVECDIKAETAKAILIRTHDTEGDVGDHWIPLSQVEEIHRKESITTGLFSDRVVMSKWIAQTKGIL